MYKFQRMLVFIGLLGLLILGPTIKENLFPNAPKTLYQKASYSNSNDLVDISWVDKNQVSWQITSPEYLISKNFEKPNLNEIERHVKIEKIIHGIPQDISKNIDIKAMYLRNNRIHITMKNSKDIIFVTASTG